MTLLTIILWHLMKQHQSILPFSSPPALLTLALLLSTPILSPALFAENELRIKGGTGLITPAPETGSKKLLTQQWVSPAALSQGASFAKTKGNRVRMRLKPSLDSQIIRELTFDEPLLIGQKIEGFYEVFPLTQEKAYIFRTYVLDNQIEGKKVNVRLKPDLKSPVIAQLTQGAPVKGVVSAASRKWLQIDMPSQVRFYVWAQYIDTISQEEFGTLAAQRFEAPQGQESPQPTFASKKSTLGQEEQEKITNKIAAAKVERSLRESSLSTSTTPLTQKSSQSYKSSTVSSTAATDHSLLAGSITGATTAATTGVTNWAEKESALEQAWLRERPEKTSQDYQQYLMLESVELKGRLLPYDASIANAPGDYLLEISPTKKVFVYSDRINLCSFSEQQVELRLHPRDAGDFAWPAFVVLDIQDLS